jgi:Putative serine esterase (DUF676)
VVSRRMKLSVGSKWIRSLLLIAMLALAVGLVLLNMERSRIATGQGGEDHRYIILIKGLTSTGGCPSATQLEPDRWRSFIKNTLAVQDDKIFSVSYAGPEGYCEGELTTFRFPQYTALDTCNGIDKAVASLSHVVNSVSAKDKDARFDIIGHSLGGFVAAYWLAKLPPGDGALTRIHSVITLDSP